MVSRASECGMLVNKRDTVLFFFSFSLKRINIEHHNYKSNQTDQEIIPSQLHDTNSHLNYFYAEALYVYL